MMIRTQTINKVYLTDEIAVVIAMITASVQALKVSSQNPVEALRYE